VSGQEIFYRVMATIFVVGTVMLALFDTLSPTRTALSIGMWILVTLFFIAAEIRGLRDD